MRNLRFQRGEEICDLLKLSDSALAQFAFCSLLQAIFNECECFPQERIALFLSGGQLLGALPDFRTEVPSFLSSPAGGFLCPSDGFHGLRKKGIRSLGQRTRSPCQSTSRFDGTRRIERCEANVFHHPCILDGLGGVALLIRLQHTGTAFLSAKAESVCDVFWCFQNLLCQALDGLSQRVPELVILEKCDNQASDGDGRNVR